jgi:hypothetical protein
LKTITRKVWILSLISLFTDTASEMLYPVMPIFLKSIGFSVILIGILEGITEATAGLCKYTSGLTVGVIVYFLVMVKTAIHHKK